jgi:hypothetical protein
VEEETCALAWAAGAAPAAIGVAAGVLSVQGLLHTMPAEVHYTAVRCWPDVAVSCHSLMQSVTKSRQDVTFQKLCKVPPGSQGAERKVLD